jgi:serine protease Do
MNSFFWTTSFFSDTSKVRPHAALVNNNHDENVVAAQTDFCRSNPHEYVSRTHLVSCGNRVAAGQDEFIRRTSYEAGRRLNRPESNKEFPLKSIPFLKTKTAKLQAFAGVLVLCGGLVVAAHGGVDPAHIHLKLADAAEGGARVTMSAAAKAAMPSVVKISASKIVKTPAAFSGDENDLFRQFFGGRNGGQFEMPPQAHREGGLGSGVIVSSDGYILTNNHVVDGATDVEVTLPDQREFKAKVIGTDPKTDIAVIHIDASNLPAITVGDSSKMQVGDAVLAIGNPYGIGQTVTAGIVSATGRGELGIEDYEDFIQTDASINPGNSGGALVNDRGELIGINTAILSGNSGGNQGIGFAVPVSLARHVMDQIVTNGHVTRAYLGVTIQEVTPSIARAIGLDGPKGAMVSDVTPDSPAERAGLKSGDVITGINGKPVLERNQLRMDIAMMGVNTPVKLQVFRNGQTINLDARTGEMPGTPVEKARAEHGNSNGALDGVSVRSLTPDLAQRAGVDEGTSGVVVTNVDPASAAASAGLRKGDVIQEVNHSKVANPSEFASALRKGKNGDSLLLVNRQGNKMYLAV